MAFTLAVKEAIWFAKVASLYVPGTSAIVLDGVPPELSVRGVIVSAPVTGPTNPPSDTTGPENFVCPIGLTFLYKDFPRRLYSVRPAGLRG